MAKETRNRSVLILVLLWTLVLCGCKDWRQYTSRAPDGKAYVMVREPALPGSGLRVEYYDGASKHELVNKSGDHMFKIAEVYWDPTGDLVGLYTCGDPLIRMAIDRTSLQSIDFSKVRAQLEDRLRLRFDIPANENPLFWTCVKGVTSSKFIAKYGDGRN